MTEQLPILVNRIQYAAKQSIQDSIISQMKMLRNSISGRKLFVLNEPELKCNVLTDHEHPKNVLPLFNDFINQAEITLLQQPFDKFINDVNNLITEQFTYYQEQQQAYNELNDKYLQTVNRLQYVNDKLNKIMETIIVENQTDKNKLLQQISMLQEQLYGKRITQIYQPDFAPVGQQSQSASSGQGSDANVLMIQMQSKQQLEKIGQLTAQIQSLQTQMAQLKQENINRSQSGMEANDNIKQLQQQIAQYQQKEEEFQKQEEFIHVIQEQLEKKDGQIFEKDTKISELNEQVAKLNEIISENEKFASSGQQEMMHELDQKTKQLNKLHEQCTQLQDKLKQVRQQNDELQTQLNDMKSENQSLKTAQQSNSDNSNQSQKALQQKDNEIKKLNDQITKLKQQVTELMMGSTKLGPKKSTASTTQAKGPEMRAEVNDQEVQTNITTIGGFSEGFDMDTMSGSSSKFQVTQNQEITSTNGLSQQNPSTIEQDKLALSGAQQASMGQNGQQLQPNVNGQGSNVTNNINKSSQKQNVLRQNIDGNQEINNELGNQNGQSMSKNQNSAAVSQGRSTQNQNYHQASNASITDDKLDINQLNDPQFESPEIPVPSNTDSRHIHMIQQNQLIQAQEQKLFDNISPQRKQLGDLQQQMIQQQHTIDELQKQQDGQSQKRISESIQKQNDTIVQYKQLLKEITKQDQQALIEAEEQLRGIMNHVDKQTQTDIPEQARVGSAKTYEQYKDAMSKQFKQSNRITTSMNTAQMGQQRTQQGGLDSSRTQNFQTINKNKPGSNRLLNSEADTRGSSMSMSFNNQGSTSKSQLDYQGNNRGSYGQQGSLNGQYGSQYERQRSSLINIQGYNERHSYHYNGMGTSSDDDDERYKYEGKRRNPYSGKVKKPHMLLMNPHSINNQDNDKLLQRELDKQTALKVVNNILSRHGMKPISTNDVISVEDVYAQLQRKKNQFTTYFMQQKNFYKPPQRVTYTQSVINLGDVMKSGQPQDDTVVITTNYFRKSYEMINHKLVEMDKSAEKELRVDIKPQDRHGQKVFRKPMLQQRLGPEIQKQVQQFGINTRQNQLVLDGASVTKQ